jgi:hypothetical protein
LCPFSFSAANNFEEEFFGYSDDLQALPENTWTGGDDALLNRFF